MDEVLIADPATRELRLWRLAGDRYEDADRSELLDCLVDDLAERLDWPATDA